MTAAASIAPVASTGPGVLDTLRCPITFPDAYESDESTTASVPGDGPPAAGRVAAGEDADAGEAERDAEQLRRARAARGGGSAARAGA